MLAAGVQPASWEALLQQSDYLSPHTPLTAATRLMLNAPTLALMKPGAYLINTARGLLVDDAALLAAVDNGKLAGAALDVLAIEPPAPDHPLLNHERIFITRIAPGARRNPTKPCGNGQPVTWPPCFAGNARLQRSIQ